MQSESESTHGSTARPNFEFWRHLADPLTGERARRFCAERVTPVADELDATDSYPFELVEAVANEGWNSYTLPTAYGGAGGPMADLLCVFEELAVGSAALGVSLITNFQTQKIIELFGAETLKERVLPRYAQGLRASYALTESGHGSDIRHLDTKARPDGDGWIINGSKAFITSGTGAELFVVLAETDLGVSVFAVDRELDGVSFEETKDAVTFGLRNGPHVDLHLREVRVAGDALIGEEGRGLRQAMITLANSRTLAGGISLGIARAALDGAFGWAKERQAFGAPILDFQGLQWYFAEHAAQLDAARLLCYQAARDLDADHDIARSSSAAKLLASNVAADIAGMAVQVCGAHGTRTSAPFGRYLRDAKVYEIAGGSSEVLKNTIFKSLMSEAR